MDMTLLIILGVLALLVVFGIIQYNKLVRLNISVDEAFAQIEVQLKLNEIRLALNETVGNKK